jgi:PAS domain S-box-containing protein
MKDEERTKEQLITELQELRNQVSEFEKLKTPRLQAEKALSDSEEIYRNFYKSNPHPMWIYDLETFAFLDVNDAAVQQYGYSREEFLSMTIKDIRPPEDVPALLENISKVTKGLDLAGTWRHIKKDQTLIYAEIISHTLTFAGRRAEVVLATDITERKRMEKALIESENELKRSNDDLQQFAYAASHDLQEPLRVVEGYVNLLVRRYRDKLDEKANELIEYAVAGIKRMQGLINDLLEYSKVGMKGLNIMPVDCAFVVEKAVSNLQAAIDATGAIVTHDRLPTVMADVSQMSRLFQNLIGNAIKFHDENPLRIHVSAQRGDGAWFFSVRDNGIGIDPEQAERIFVIFQRLHTREEYPGTGIGLAICKRIVERHCGTIWVESEPGKGSSFCFTIPDREEMKYEEYISGVKPGGEYALNRRREYRVKQEIPFDFNCGEQHFAANTSDLSDGGLSINIFGQPCVTVGNTVNLSIGYLRVRAKVIWVEKSVDKSLIGLQKFN